jgi:GT2 family glycosyltransferase
MASRRSTLIGLLTAGTLALTGAVAGPAVAGVGGPNVPPRADSASAHQVARAPGGPLHVLLSDDRAEHIPGCNMAFRREALIAIGGFDPRFRVAGDDVDICWRLQERGWTIGFSPGAVVLHSRRRTVRAYLRQQAEYGKAEALLERKWPQRYNRRGHVVWSGTVYGAPPRSGHRRRRNRHGSQRADLRSVQLLSRRPQVRRRFAVRRVGHQRSRTAVVEPPTQPIHGLHRVQQLDDAEQGYCQSADDR